MLTDDFVGESGDGAGGDDYAAVHDGEAVGEFFAEVEILLHEEDAFVVLAAAGLVCQFGLQALINMAVNVQIAPSKGMTLPFISYGGSSMLALSIATGLLLAFTRRNPYLTRSPYVVKWGGESAKQ